MDIDDLSALLGEDVTAASAADIWVVTPEGQAAARLVGEARRLADGLGCYVHAVVAAGAASEAQAAACLACGADRVHVAADAAGYLEAQQPEFVLFDAAESAAAAQLAQRKGAGLITGVRGPLSVDESTRALLGAHPVYDGEYCLDLAVTSTVKIATVVTGDLAEPYRDAGRTGEISVGDTGPAEPRVRDLGPAEHTPPAWRPLSKARVIVSAGRGVRDEEGFALAGELARVLGADLAGDRSALSSGWIDEAHMVDVTGQEVAPAVYLAVGILGDTQHNAAISGARRVIAVHANPAAPVFKAADMAIVSEPKAWTRALLAALGEV
jgi:electron transfer flavoprotein alpha subunit